MSVITDWLRLKIADEAGVKIENIDIDQKFVDFNLDSLASISLSFDIEKEYRILEINPTVFSQFDTISKLALWIESQK